MPTALLRPLPTRMDPGRAVGVELLRPASTTCSFQNRVELAQAADRSLCPQVLLGRWTSDADTGGQSMVLFDTLGEKLMARVRQGIDLLCDSGCDQDGMPNESRWNAMDALVSVMNEKQHAGERYPRWGHRSQRGSEHRKWKLKALYDVDRRMPQSAIVSVDDDRSPWYDQCRCRWVSH